MPIQAQKPAAPKGTPYAPEALEPFLLESFQGVNTVTTRAGVPDQYAYWIDGFMPIAERNLRTLPDLGSTLFTRTSTNTIVFFEFYVLGGTPYMVVLQSDGSLTQVNVNTQATKTILAAGGITVPTILNVGFSQWAETYLLIVANQPNGYWVWDGSTLYTAGTLGPIITITDPGSAYKSPPAVVFHGGLGTGASAVAIIANGVVTSISLVNPGSGYIATDSVGVSLVGGNGAGSGGSLTAIMGGGSGSGGSVTVGFTVFVSGFTNFGSITGAGIANVGSGYSALTQLQVLWAGAVPYYNNALLGVAVAGGTLAGVSVINHGNYILPSSPGSPSVLVTDPGQFFVSSVTINAVGSNYSDSASVQVIGGGSTSLTSISIVSPANIGLKLNNQSIASVLILSGGVYNASVAPTLSVVDTVITATATAELMPFGIQGTSVETYQGYVWIVQGAVLYNSAPGSISDFATADGGGNRTSNSSKLRIGYTRLIAVNGFLYTIADSSIDYVSAVQTSGSPISTTLSWLNADPETGSPYPEGVMTWGRGLFLCNAFGIHVLFGSEAKKISEPLDGVYNTVANFNSQQLSVAEHTVFGRKLALALVPIIDPVKGTQVNKLLCFDNKRWFATEQSLPLTYIKHQEINSTITAYGTNGTVVRPLFTSASAEFTKTIQSRLWDMPGGYQFDKGLSRFWSIWQYNASVATTFSVLVDALDNTNAFNSQTYTISGPSVTGYFASPPQAVGQQGPLVGMTIKTNCADAQLVSAMLQPELAEYRG